jgi:hypothetical protein
LPGKDAGHPEEIPVNIWVNAGVVPHVLIVTLAQEVMVNACQT